MGKLLTCDTRRDTKISEEIIEEAPLTEASRSFSDNES